jgi:hypothetical protein
LTPLLVCGPIQGIPPCLPLPPLAQTQLVVVEGDLLAPGAGPGWVLGVPPGPGLDELLGATTVVVHSAARCVRACMRG